MMSLLVFKERLKAFYGKYDIYIRPVIKFLFSFAAFILMNQNIGYMAALKNPMVPFAAALVCAFIPYGAITMVAGGFLLAHLFSLSLELFVLAAILILILGLLYYGFRPGDSYLLILTPMLFLLKVPYVIPLLVGLSGGLVSVIPVSCGVIIYYMILYVKQNAGVLANDASLDITQKYVQILNGIFSNKLMMVMIAAFAVSILAVWVIRNLSIDYAWVIAIAAGTIAQLVVIFIGDFTLSASVSIVQLLFGVLVSAAIAGAYHFFVFAVDYTRTEYIQFEDDDYCYYVKAVPKIAVTAPDVKVQKINSRKTQKPAR